MSEHTNFLDQMWSAKPVEISSADLQRYVEEAPSMKAVAPAVRQRLRDLITSACEQDRSTSKGEGRLGHAATESGHD